MRILPRAIAIAVVSTLVETLALAGIVHVLELRVAVLSASLLFLSCSVLGAVLGARQHVRGAPSAPMIASIIPFIACAVLVSPRIALGPHLPCLAPLGVIAFFAPLVERAWIALGPRTTRATLGAAGPACAIGLLTGCAIGAHAIVISLASIALSAVIVALPIRRARRTAREAELLREHVRKVEIGVDAIVRPEPPVLRDHELLAIERGLAARLDTLAFVASADARAREQIADAGQLRTRFMASMSHELRSPLNSIVGFAEILGRGMEGVLTAEQRESVALIRRSAEELILLLTDILDLARLEAGKLALSRSWTPSVEIITEAIGRARPIVEGRDVEIEAELQPGLPPVHVDKKRIVQAVVALFRNAAPGMRKTRVRLRARIAEGPPGPARHLRVEISNVIGAIGRENVDRIFEAFQEIKEPTGRRVGGLGMALALARGLVRLHGGEVWAEPMQDAGTMLCVAIPLEAGPSRAP